MTEILEKEWYEQAKIAPHSTTRLLELGWKQGQKDIRGLAIQERLAEEIDRRSSYRRNKMQHARGTQRIGQEKHPSLELKLRFEGRLRHLRWKCFWRERGSTDNLATYRASLSFRPPFRTRYPRCASLGSNTPKKRNFPKLPFWA